jgi:hypothetical protein
VAELTGGRLVVLEGSGHGPHARGTVARHRSARASRRDDPSRERRARE